MMINACQHEPELQNMIGRGHWPHGSDPELISHVQACSKCQECLLVTAAFQAARANTQLHTPAGSAGVLWWRAQLRIRNAALEKMNRPCQGAALFALLLAALAFIALVRVDTILEPLRPWSSAVGAWNLTLTLSGAGILALLGGVAVYLASEK